MKIEDVIRRKGNDVVTVVPTSTVEELVRLLEQYNIGAVVVSADGTHIDGIVSERDIVRAMAKSGGDTLNLTVAELMTSDVTTAGLHDEIEETARTMTTERIRHMPVLVEDRLTAIISIGDVVKHRIDQLTDERDHLLGYLHT